MIQYVNSTMSEINSYSDDLYEALIDGDSSVPTICDNLIKVLRDVKQSYYERIQTEGDSVNKRD